MILQRIVEHKREELTERKAAVPEPELRRHAVSAPPPADFAAALTAPGVSLIAEIKRASPSAGPLRADFDPLALARTYVQNGARALSVLTDERFFGGTLAHLTAVKAVSSSPALCKDFFLDPYQLYEARAAGADAVLLIVAILDDVQLADLLTLTRELSMAALVEVHDEGELDRALAVGPRIVGVNNRDLRDFSVRLETTLRLRPRIPDGTIVVAESGIHTRADVQRLAEAGVDAVLVGTALMRAADVGAKVRELVGWNRP
ncbi:MAG: indole-3-glycerol phosphate synthase TrpC [Anaerolineae bacterium]